MVPLEILFDWCTERLTKKLETSGKVGGFVGDLITVTCDNAIEAALAIWLLIKCELRVLQSTIIGVIVLHLLFVQGASFLFGGIQLQGQGQALHTHRTDMNRSLLTIGYVLSAIYSLSHEVPNDGSSNSALSDDTRHQLLVISRGFSVILIVVYVLTRVYLYFSATDGKEGNISEILRRYRVEVHKARRALRLRTTTIEANSPTENDGSDGQRTDTLSSPALKRTDSIPKEHLLRRMFKVIWKSRIETSALIATTVAMAYTAECLVESLDDLRASGVIKDEFFGLVILPLASFSASGISSIWYFLHSIMLLNKEPHWDDEAQTATKGSATRKLPKIKALPIELSIQYILFWTSFFVLLGWWIHKPVVLMFDFYELVILVTTIYLLDSVTHHEMINWAKGLIMISLYAMIALSAWFYRGQLDQEILLNCPGSVAAALSAEA
ncbi:hypothetical protein EIP86_004413 [Pleurotus ostreatoroseus]|nr:hypothetical protein EIP86_004413 [Pleurotus ostreatoroseus]